MAYITQQVAIIPDRLEFMQLLVDVQNAALFRPLPDQFINYLKPVVSG